MSSSRYTSHCNSQVATAKARYSSSSEDLNTNNYLFVRHEIIDFPKKNHWPEIDLLVSTHLAQSTSEKPMRWRYESRGKIKPQVSKDSCSYNEMDSGWFVENLAQLLSDECDVRHCSG